MLSNTLRLTSYHSKMMGHILKSKQKEQACLYLWINENEDENEKRSHRYDLNRPRTRHGHKYSKYKKCLSMMMLICIKQHLSNTCSSGHEKVKQHWDWVEKSGLIKTGVWFDKENLWGCE